MKTTRRIISAVLCVLMIGSVLPLTAFAAYENTHNNTGNQIEDLIAVATTQLGYTEGNSTAGHGGTTGGSGNYTKYGAWYGINPGAWCAMFVSWCANQAGISTSIIPKHASCDIGMQWFQSKSKWQWSPACGGSYTPKRGDIIYFRTNTNQVSDSTHVGIVYNYSSGRVYTIEGNASNKCMTKDYPVSSANILGYGTPAYTSGGSSSTTDYVPGTYKVTADGLNMRAESNASSAIVYTLSKGNQITVTAVANTKWGYCTYNGVSGWVSLVYCQIVAESNKHYTLTLDPNGGIQTTGQSSYSIDHGTKYSDVMGSSMPQAARSGYTFNGWLCEKYNYLLKLSDTYGVNEDSVFKAQWTAQLGYYTITTKTDPLNMRSGPGSSEGIVTTVPKGTVVDMTSIYGDWGYCTYGSYSGWLSLAYCTYNPGYTPPSTPSVPTYTLTFNPNGGSMPSGVATTYKFENNQKFVDVIGVFPIPTHSDPNKEFKGWQWENRSTHFWTDGWGTQPYDFGINITIDAVWGTHTHSYSSTVTKQATCTAAGVKTFICESCGHSYTESIAKKGHSYSSAVTKQPSCGSSGVRTFTCSNCGSSYTESIAMLSHSYDINGIAVTCKNCGAKYNGFFTKNNAQYFCINGDVQKGIINTNGSYYYAGSDRIIVKNTVVNIPVSEKNGYLRDCDESFYLIDADGKLVGNGFVTYNGVTRYYENYELVTGFTRIGNDYYYFGTNGNMAVNTSIEINGKMQYFLSDGRMHTEVLEDYDIIKEGDVSRLYINNAVADPGTYYDGTDYYYVKSDKTLACDEIIFTFHSDGTVLPKGYYEFDDQCKLVKDDWLTVTTEANGSRTFYFINGHRANGLTKIGNDYYFFNLNNGEMRTDVNMWVNAKDGLSTGVYHFGSDGRMTGAVSVAANYFVADGVETAAATIAVAEESNDAVAFNAVIPTVIEVVASDEDDN